jgi:hypothetical protein
MFRLFSNQNVIAEIPKSYGLPKVHKSEVISNAILEQHTECIKILNPDDLKFRPIVGQLELKLSHRNHSVYNLSTRT